MNNQFELLLNHFFNSDIFSDDFFLEIAQNKLKIPSSELKIGVTIFTNATQKTINNYSAVFRGKFKVKVVRKKCRFENIDFVLKASFLTVPELKSLSVYPREKLMYGDVVKSFERIWRKRRNEIVEFAPKCYKILSNPYDVLVLEDLTSQGYRVMDRKIGLNLHQSKLVLKKLAKFHAASAVRYQKSGKIHDCLDRSLPLPIIAPDNPIAKSFAEMHTVFVNTICSSLKLSNSCKEKVTSWSIQSLLVNSRIMIPRVAAQPMRNGFQVLNHGDVYTNNLLFNEDENGKSIDVKFLDYQMSFWGSPMADLIYFLLTSVKDDIKTAHFDELVAFYHKELVLSLNNLKYKEDAPTLDVLKQDLMEKRGFIHGLFLHALVVAKYDSDEEFDLLGFMRGSLSDGETLKRMYRNVIYLKAIEFWLPFFENRGLLDKTF